MTAHPDPALVICGAHEARRRAPLPPLGDLLPEGDDMPADAQAAAERVGAAYDAAVTP